MTAPPPARASLDPQLASTPDALLRILRAAPSVERLVAVDEAGEPLGSAGGAVAPDAGAAVSRLWATACRAAANRSPAALDHLVLRTTIGDVVVVRTQGLLLAAVGRDGTRPDRVAYELRRAADHLDPGMAETAGEPG